MFTERTSTVLTACAHPSERTSYNLLNAILLPCSVPSVCCARAFWITIGRAISSVDQVASVTLIWILAMSAPFTVATAQVTNKAATPDQHVFQREHAIRNRLVDQGPMPLGRVQFQRRVGSRIRAVLALGSVGHHRIGMGPIGLSAEAMVSAVLERA
jgi:hypothetical protein